MKKSLILMSLVLGALALSSCNNSDIQKIDGSKGVFTFTVTTDTRAGIDNKSVVWQAGDQIALGAAKAGDTSTVAKIFDWVSGNTFSGDTTFDAGTNYDFYAVYPAIKGGWAYTTDKLTKTNSYSKWLTFGGKTITQEGQTMDHVMAIAPMYGTAKSVTPGRLNITMHHAAALLDFTVKNGTASGVTIKSLKMETPSGNPFCGTYYLSYDGAIKPSGDTYVYTESEVVVNNGTELAANTGEFHVYMPIAPCTLANGTEITFTITTTDDKLCTIKKTLTKSVTFAAGTISTQTLLYEGGSSVVYNTLSEVLTAGVGTYNVKDAMVLATTGKNVVVSDGTANMLVYFSKAETVADGDVLSFSGQTSVFNSVLEFKDPVWEKTGVVTPFDRGSAITYSESDLAAMTTAITIEYIKLAGEFKATNELKVGTTALQPYPATGLDTTGLVGKPVETTGYVIGYSSTSSKFSFVATSMKEVALPKITLPSTSASFEAADNGSAVKKSIDFTAELTNVTITCSTADWLSFTADNANKHFEFYPISANTGTDDRTATVTIAASAGSQYNQTFTITQKGTSSSSELTATLTLKSGTTFGTKSPATMTDDKGFTWTATCANLEAWNNDYKGQQLGTSKTNVTATITADFGKKTIKSVSIIAAAGSTTPTYNISVDSKSWKSGSLSKTPTTYTGTGSGSGVITIEFDQNSGSKAMYIGGVIVTYTE